jgi:hypothetical protein
MLGMLVKFIAQLAVNTALTIAFGTAVAAAATAAMSPVLAINTAAATAAAIATLGGAVSAAALVVPTMAANVAAAQGLTLLGGIAHSGLDYVPSEGTYLLNKGERVIQPEQNRDLTEALDGGGIGGARVLHLTLKLEGREIGEALYDLTRIGLLQIDPGAVR